MSFREPLFLLAILAVPLLGLLYWTMQGQRQAEGRRFADPALLPNLVTGQPGWRRHVPVLLLLAAIASLSVAIARPERTVSKPKRQATVMLVTDVSASMNATDVRPNRLAAAQAAARRFAKQVPETFGIGFVAFNASAELRLPPTTDRPRLEAVVEGLRAEGGTAMGDGIQTAVQAIRQRQREQQQGFASAQPTPSAIILLSDGANSAGAAEPRAAAEEARRLNVPIYAIALGTEQGTITLTNPLGIDQTVAVPPDSETLRDIADITRGRFFDAADSDQLDRVYQALGSRIGFERVPQEITVLFVGLGVVLLLVGGGLGVRWFGRPV